MLTISQLADYAGVTVRAVRHYHRIGLLPEPERDALGYRQYGSDAVVRLVRIRTLAGAGVPLSRVAELLEASKEEFAAALAEVDADLAGQIAQLEAHRRRLASLTDPDAGVLGPKAHELFEVIEPLTNERYLAVERESAVLMAVLQPDRVEEWMAGQLEALRSEDVRELYRLSSQVDEWEPDDPRIEDLARRSVALTMRLYPPDRTDVRDWWDEMDGMSYQLIEQHGAAYSAPWRRLTQRVSELLAEAGYDLPDDRRRGRHTP